MSLKRTWSILRKDLKLGPRHPFFLLAVIMPVALTLIFQLAFGSLFEPKPRLGIVDQAQSEITSSVQQMEGIELTLLDDVATLKKRVKENDLDAGLVLPAGFDEAVRAGKKPPLELYLGGESLASHRIIITATAIDLLRGIEGGEAPVKIKTVQLGEGGLPIALRLVPMLVFYALVMAGLWVPAASLVEEKEKGTFTALLVSPARTKEILAAKWILGFILSLIMAAVTLLLNRAFGPRPLEVLVVIAVAALLNCMLGLLVGVVSKNSTMFFSLVKGTGIFLFAPVVFYIFPDWPQWMARIFPLYWVIEPIWQVSVMGQPLVEVWLELAVALAITLALVPAIAALNRRAQQA